MDYAEPRTPNSVILPGNRSETWLWLDNVQVGREVRTVRNGTVVLHDLPLLADASGTLEGGCEAVVLPDGSWLMAFGTRLVGAPAQCYDFTLGPFWPQTKNRTANCDSLAVVRSTTNGTSWNFTARIDWVPEMSHNVGGLCEPSLVVNDAGCAIIVFRLNGDAPFYRHPVSNASGYGDNGQLWKAVSCDNGATFSRPARMDGVAPYSNVWAVWPHLRKMSNGVLVLTSGRPTIGLWVCADGTGDNWSFINLARVHNLLYPPCGGQAILSSSAVAECDGWPESNVKCKDWACDAPETITSAYR